MARVWHLLAKHLRNCCHPGAECHPNIKGAVWSPEVIVKKVKNEHRFIGLRTYVHWPTNIGSLPHEHRFIFFRIAVGTKTALTGISQKITDNTENVVLNISAVSALSAGLIPSHRLDKFTVNYMEIHVNTEHELPRIIHVIMVVEMILWCAIPPPPRSRTPSARPAGD